MVLISYCQTTDLALMLPNADTTLLPIVIDAVSRKIDDVCQRYFGNYSGTKTYDLGMNHSFDRHARNQIVIDDFVPDDTTTVSLGGVTIPSTDYWFLPYNQLPIFLFLLNGYQIDWTQFGAATNPPRTVEITGTWGFPVVPSPIKNACMLLTRIAYQGMTSRFAKSERMGEYQISYADVEQSLNDDQIAKMVSLYIRHNVA
jgi:hypothetical protein